MGDTLLNKLKISDLLPEIAKELEVVSLKG
jgi:hypothetical protein